MTNILKGACAQPTDCAVRTEKLIKKFGDLTALKGVDLSILRGELFGLLGVNGAGKTTLIKILCGLLKPDGGEAYVLGKNAEREIGEIKRRIAVSPQETSVALNLTVKENLIFFSQIYGYVGKNARTRADEIIARFGLEEVANKYAKTLSGGWQRRLSIAISLVGDPELIFLDEPTLGLDVLARRELWKIIEGLKGKVTIVLTSHYLEETERLCDRVAIMAKGNVLCTGSVEQIKYEAQTDSFEDAFVKIVEEKIL